MFVCEVRLAPLPAPGRACTIKGVTTVLIVDDHPSFRASARAILEADGFDVVGEAANGETALRAARTLRPDLMLLDIQLPDMTGFELCAALEHAGDGLHPAVVLVSSRDQSDFGQLVAESSARGFVPKAELSGDAVSALLA